jgi:hypothetical protein
MGILPIRHAFIRHRGSNQVSYRIDLLLEAKHALCIGEGRAQHEQGVANSQLDIAGVDLLPGEV